MKITASQIKQNSSILQKALFEDIVVTKRDHPFVVIVEYEKYRKMSEKLAALEEEGAAKRMRERWLSSARESEAHLDTDDRKLYDALSAEAAGRFGNDDA